MLYKRTYLYIGVMILTLLAACNGVSTQEEIYNYLEKTIELESGFEAQQDKIVALEKQEQEIYDKIAALESSEFDQIKKLSEEAIISIKKRSEEVGLEKESIDQARATFDKIMPLIEKLEERDVKNKAEEMYKVMTERYQTYDQLHESYVLSMEEEIELYTMLQNKDVTQEQFTGQITVMNEVYGKVIQQNDEMNKATDMYNSLRQEFNEMTKTEASTKND